MNDDVKAAVEWARGAVESHDMYRGARDERDGSVENMRALLAHIDGEPARIAAAREEQRAADVARSRKAKYALTGGKTSLAGAWNAGIESAIEGVESMPLTATPLADALRLANETVVKLAQAATEAQARADEGVRYWTDLAQAEARDAAALRARVAELEAELAMVRAAGKELTLEFEGVEAERDVLRARVFEVEQRQVGYVLVSFASHEQWKAELAELGALRARLDALYGVILFAHAFAEAEPLVSGYVRLHGHILHLREIHALARVAADVLAAMDEAKP